MLLAKESEVSFKKENNNTAMFCIYDKTQMLNLQFKENFPKLVIKCEHVLLPGWAKDSLFRDPVCGHVYEGVRLLTNPVIYLTLILNSNPLLCLMQCSLITNWSKH